MRRDIINALEKEKIITIVRGIERKSLIPLAEAMYRGGIRMLELTYDAKGDVSDEEIAANIEMLVTYFAGKMYIGAGTVVSARQVELTKAAGGSFIISPDTNREVIERTRELELVSIPGALTPTEIQTAHRYGADFVKLFPVTSLGADYVKAIRAPLSHIKLLAVGGINENNMAEYLNSGICGFGVGSNIVDKKLIISNDFEKITELAKKYTRVIAE